MSILYIPMITYTHTYLHVNLPFTAYVHTCTHVETKIPICDYIHTCIRKSIHLSFSYTYICTYVFIPCSSLVARSLTTYPLPRVLASQNAKRDRIAWRGRGAHAGCALAFPSTRARVLEGYTYTCGMDSPVGVGIGIPITK